MRYPTKFRVQLISVRVVELNDPERGVEHSKYLKKVMTPSRICKAEKNDFL